MLHAGGKFGGGNSGYKISGGLHGVGISVVNALSVSLEATVSWRSPCHMKTAPLGLPANHSSVQWCKRYSMLNAGAS